jgi:hypothetical protein
MKDKEVISILLTWYVAIASSRLIRPSLRREKSLSPLSHLRKNTRSQHKNCLLSVEPRASARNTVGFSVFTLQGFFVFEESNLARRSLDMLTRRPAMRIRIANDELSTSSG